MDRKCPHKETVTCIYECCGFCNREEGVCELDGINDGLVHDDAVSHPSHYTYGKIECIDFILDKGLDFPLGNAIKYIVRAGRKKSNGMDEKDKTIEDLSKAIQYIDFEIQKLKGERP